MFRARFQARRIPLIACALSSLLGLSAGFIAIPSANAAASWCRPWAFVGVPGSNQGLAHSSDPWGPEVADIRANFLRARPSSTVMNFPIEYPARLTTDLDDYVASREAGLYEIKRVMNVIVDSCPDARIVIAGYSQGADIAGRIVNFAGWAPRARIYRVALIGNLKYSQYNDDVSVPVGGSYGEVGPGFFAPMQWDAWAESRTKDVCIDDDIACDTDDAMSGPSWVNLATSLGDNNPHHEYRNRLFPNSNWPITAWLGERYLGGQWQP